MVNIQPLTFPINGDATKLYVYVQGFSSDAATCTVKYALLTNDEKVCLDASYTLTDSEFTAWGQDNSYLDSLIANKLNLTIIT